MLDELTRMLARHNAAVLVAPPGAGKTTRVPLALLDAPWRRGKKIIVLEPRRIAARASAERMAKSLGERAGETVGYRVRFGSKVSRATRIEVVTEGIFSRQILDDPELTGVAAVLFDEFHERSLDADLGLALARDAQTGLREDLRILVMSATLDGARVARMLGDAPVVASEGRAFAVETRYLGRKADVPLERQMADAIAMALRADPGSVLAFLPGAAEIRRTQTLLSERIHDATIEIVPLFGALDAAVQDRAIAPAPQGHRKIVLATSIAETSLTIEGVRIVVDSGVARVPRYEPDIGLTRLETVRASRAAVDQRRGRAGRTEPGVCYRLWDEPQTASLARLYPAGNPQCRSVVAGARPRAMGRRRSRHAGVPGSAAGAGAEGGAQPAARTRRARRRRPDHRRRPQPARAGVAAAAGAHDRGIASAGWGRGRRRDCRGAHRARPRWRQRRSRCPARPIPPRPLATRRSARSLARRWAVAGCVVPVRSGRANRRRGSVAAHHRRHARACFPDRVARNRGNGSFVLANGRGAAVDPTSALARAPYIAVAELTGTAAQGRILLAAPIALADIEVHFADQIETADEISFDRGAMALRARRRRTLHAMTLSEAPLALTTSAETARVLADGLIAAGIEQLPWSKPVKQWRDRVMFLRKAEGDRMA